MSHQHYNYKLWNKNIHLLVYRSLIKTLITFAWWKVEKARITCITFVIYIIGFTIAFAIVITDNTCWAISVTITSFENETAKVSYNFWNLEILYLLRWHVGKLKKPSLHLSHLWFVKLGLQLQTPLSSHPIPFDPSSSQLQPYIQKIILKTYYNANNYDNIM